MGLNEQIPHLLSSLFFLFTLLERLLLLVKMRILEAFVALIHLLGLTKPGTLWSRELLPVGNGYQAARQRQKQLTVVQAYNGGNKLPGEQTAMAKAMDSIRQTLFHNPTGDIDTIEVLATDPGQYGNAVSSTGPVTGYSRWLDLDKGVARTTWTQAGTRYLRPTSTLYSFIFRVSASSSVRCVQFPVPSGFPPNATIEVTGTNNSTGLQEAHATWVGSTDYSMDAGDAAHNFTFRGADPHSSLLAFRLDFS
ncbi:hypothetical protein K443DRAFT_122514 [Laccaria amethystina LaAM-08-1]|uniref:Glycosyl hydrolase family 95 N-terminal domain-containing protein n=1 Tax=Laccaria amethystina LaAM-08-1 TaxID=1095629 RepID=A0A0C9XU18_9AGAR|nr:hypothetical protein K443DRAFT_122514 [Laccaria amethystina LaAM-08-1]